MIFDGQAYLLPDRYDHTTLGRAVEFREHDARTVYRLGKLDRLADAVLARRGIQNQDHLMRRGGHLLTNGLLDLRQLGHQIFLRLQSACRIDDAHFRAVFESLLDRAVRDACRMASRRTGHDRHAQPFAPNRQVARRRPLGTYRRRREAPSSLGI